jgi:hypothetical protein
VNFDGEAFYNSARDFFVPLQGEEKYCTEGFKEIALIYGATEESYRKTSALLNRIRHQECGGTPSRTIQAISEHEGLILEDHLEQKVLSIFQDHHFTPEGVPPSSVLESLIGKPSIEEEVIIVETFPISIMPESFSLDILSRPFPHEENEDELNLLVNELDIERLNERVKTHDLEEQIRKEMLQNPVPYEKREESVCISVDDVVAKQQKESRKPKSSGPPGKRKRKYVHNTVIHVEQGDGFYILNGYGIWRVLRLLLGFLLNNDLLSHHLVFFVDGNSLYSSVVQYFCWHPQVSVILDWYHLKKKCRELLSMASKGSKIRNAILEELMPLLWYGLVDQAIAYLSHIAADQIKNNDELKHLMSYLEKNRGMIPVYAVRRELGLRNSSNRGEKANDLLVAARQKHNGMSWSKTGSVALAYVTALKKNQTYKTWFRQRELEFKLVS